MNAFRYCNKLTDIYFGGNTSGDSSAAGAPSIPGNTDSRSAAVGTVTISDPSTASGTITTNLSNARKGDTVTIIPEARSGYISAPPTVKGMGSYVYIVPTTKNADGCYAFTMPEDVVTITGSFTTPTVCETWYQKGMSWAVQTGIIVGSDGKLNSQDFASRAELAAILTRYCQNIKK